MSVKKLAKIIYSKRVSVRAYGKERWKRGLACNRCGSVRVWKHGRLRCGLWKYRCQDCKHVFSEQSKTVFHGSKMPIESRMIVWHESHYKTTCRDTADKAGVGKNAVHRLNKRIMELKALLVEKPVELSGIVEGDETMINGKWFLGFYKRKGDYIVQPIPNRSETVISKCIWKYLGEGTTLMTDQLASYQPHPRFYRHFTVNHSKEFVSSECRLIHTNTIEGLWMHIKREVNHFRLGVKLENIMYYVYQQKYNKNHKKCLNINLFPLLCPLFN